MRFMATAIALLGLTGCSGSLLAPVAPAASAAPTNPTASVAPVRLWPAPAGADADAAIQAASLGEMDMSPGAPHLHVHLDVFKDGQPVVVPGGIGGGTKMMASLHTHGEAGVVHVEGGPNTPLKLAQFFTLWRVPLDGATAYVNGTPAPDPGAVLLVDQQQITVVFGTPPASIPSSYAGPWN